MTIAPTRRRADPLARLHARHALDADDRVNDVLLAAGLRYRELSTAAEYPGPASADPTKAVVDGGRGQGGSDRSAAARNKLRAINATLGPRHLPILVGFVVDEHGVGELRHLVVDTRDRACAEAIAVDRLRDCLHRLAEHWGLLKVNVSSPIVAWIST